MINRKKIKYLYIIFLLCILLDVLLIVSSCNTTDPGDDKGDNSQDTTSHNYTWQTWKFGEHSSSILYDVAVIDKNNIYAVGEIYINDSTGEADPHPYNALHWDGVKWKLLRIPTLAWNSTDVFWSDPLKAVWAFNESNIWVTTGGQVINYNGTKWTKHRFLSTNIYDTTFGGINKFWGDRNSRLWGAGLKENIWFLDGLNWQKINSKTGLDSYDIYGAYLENGDYELYSAAAKHTISTDKKIMKIENNTVKDISTTGIRSSLSSLWFKSGQKYYAVGVGMYTKKDINSDEPWEEVDGITGYYLYSIDGQELNDIAACGSYGELLHFNGKSWKSYKNELGLNAGAYKELKINNDMIIAVGYDSPKAVIVIGKR